MGLLADVQVQEMDQRKDAKVKKMMIILSKATIDNVYACMILANGARMEGIDAEIFFTFFGLEAIQKKKLEHLHVATVGNPAMHIPTLLGGLPGMEAFATSMRKKEMEKKDLIDELDVVLTVGDFYERAGGENTHLLFI